MAQPRRRAKFFVLPGGEVYERSKPITRRLAREIYSRDGGRCKECGTKVRFGGNSVSPWDLMASGAIDHVFPISRGGSNSKENLRLLCMSCNSSKGAR